MAMHLWQGLNRVDLAEVATDSVAVLPMGATEQHGPHLASGTDSILVGEIAERACRRAESIDTLLLPTLNFGASDHHLAFGATLSLSQSTLQGVLGDLIASAGRAGVRRLLLLNGHGGNVPSARAAAARGSLEEEMIVAVCSYWELIDPPGSYFHPGHAGHFESSMMLALDPEYYRPGTGPPPESFPAPHRGMRIENPSYWRSCDGYTDDPSGADADEGELFLERCADGVADAILRLGSETLG